MEIKTDTRKEASEQDMDCIEEIIRRLSMHGLVDENCVRVILNDYNISQKCTEVIPANEDRTQKAIRMFLMTKKVEGCTENTICYYKGTLQRFFGEVVCQPTEVGTNTIRYYLAVRATRDGLGKVSQDNELRVLKSFFRWCAEEDLY